MQPPPSTISRILVIFIYFTSSAVVANTVFTVSPPTEFSSFTISGAKLFGSPPQQIHDKYLIAIASVFVIIHNNASWNFSTATTILSLIHTYFHKYHPHRRLFFRNYVLLRLPSPTFWLYVLAFIYIYIRTYFNPISLSDNRICRCCKINLYTCDCATKSAAFVQSQQRGSSVSKHIHNQSIL